MVEVLCHESFYISGTWSDENLGVYVGWVAQKGSFSEAMPLSIERGDVTLVFSGEEFGERGAASHLKEHRHALHLEGPSYLVHLYEEDPAFPKGLNGRFHGILINRGRGTTTLFNDRYGMHRIYYHQSKEAFYFAAEAKAILKVRPELRKTDPRGIGEFIACGCVLENRTLFKEIHVLQGEGVGRTITARSPGLLPEAPQCVFRESASVLQWEPACCDVVDRRTRYQDDPGMA